MSKRFFSLLLVLCMALSLAAPALAATDEPAVAKTGDFYAAYDKEDGSYKKAIEDAEAHINAEGDVDCYTPDSWAALIKAYNEALALVDQYDATPSMAVETTDVTNLKEALQKALQALCQDPIEKDVTGLEAALKAAKDLVDGKTLTSAANEVITKGTGVSDFAGTETIQTTLDAYKDAVKAAAGKALNNALYTRKIFAGYTKAINDVVAAQSKHVNTVSVKLDEAKFVDAESATETKVTVNYVTGPDDDNLYALTAQYGTGDIVYVYGDKDGKSAAKGVNALKTGTDINLATLIPTNNDQKKSWANGDKVTVTLYVAEEIEHRYTGDPHYAYTQVGEPIVITYPIPTPAPADLAVKSSGFVTDVSEAQGLSDAVKAAINDKDDSFYIELNKKQSEIKAMTAYTGYSIKLYWRITCPNGKSPAPVEITNGDATAYAWEATDSQFLEVANGAKNITSLPAGDYTVEVIAVDSVAVGAAATVVVSETVTVKALDKSGLTAYLTEKGLDDETAIAANFGPYAKVTTLINHARNAKTYAAKAEAETTDSLAEMGVLDEAKGTYTEGSHFEKVRAALGDVYSIVALREIVEKAEALTPADYPNWYTGTMGGKDGALYNAKKALLAATSSKEFDFTYLDIENNKETEKKETAQPIDDSKKQADIDKLVADLQKAMDLLDGALADTKPLETLIDTVPADGSKYTKATWDAVEKAVADAEALIEAKPLKSEQDKVDAAVKALQDALKALEVKTGEVEKVTEGGKDYIIEDGEKLTGVQEVDGKLYYASVKDAHVLKGGLLTGEAGKKYLAGDDGVLKLGYQKVGDKAYYFAKDGHMLRNGIVTGTGKQYVAAKDGVLGTGLVTATNGNKYYCSVKDNHIMKAPKGKGTAPVIGPNGAKYTVNEKGVVVG